MSKQKQAIPEDEFKIRVRLALMYHSSLDGIADQLQVAPSTIQRWALGTARPFPRLRQNILEVLEAKPRGKVKR
jgi:transcriptional regulator with XRE-family HTH domain